MNEATLFSVVLSFEEIWMAQFWSSETVQGDQAFAHGEFMSYPREYGIAFRAVPSRRRHKNPLKPKHGVTRSIFLRLQSAQPQKSTSSIALKAMRVSDDLYRSDTANALELAKGFSKPMERGSPPVPLPDNIVEARHELRAKQAHAYPSLKDIRL